MTNWSTAKGRTITTTNQNPGGPDASAPAPASSPQQHQQPQQQAAARLAAIHHQLSSSPTPQGAAIPGNAVESLSRARPPPSARAHAQRDWKHLPSFAQLPVLEGAGVPGCAWKVFGHGDQLGTVNLLTDGVVAQAAKEEIKTGTAISLNWPLHLPLQPFFSHPPLEHRLTIKPPGAGTVGGTGTGATDTLVLNSHAGGSRWEGLRSIGLSKHRVYYQGVRAAELGASFQSQSAGPQPQDSPTSSTASPSPPSLRAHRPGAESEDDPSLTLGIQHWARHGISGRGVLLDVYGYKLRNAARKSRNRGGKAYDPMTSHAITLQDLKETARAQGVKFRQGDILLIRSGFTNAYYNSTPAQRAAWAARRTEEHAFAGVEQGTAVAAWFWDHHFAAAASDSPTFEAWPPTPSKVPAASSTSSSSASTASSSASSSSLTGALASALRSSSSSGGGSSPPTRRPDSLRELLVPMMGMPIGVQWDLEALTRHCVRTRRWTFFLTSAPANVYGGAAGGANAFAFF